MTLVDAAHDYIRRGWGVIPLHGWDAEKNQCLCSVGRFCPEKNRGKHPALGLDWQKRALTSGADVEAWYEDHPTNNVGILTGATSGIFVFDVDGGAGIRSVTEFATERGALPPTRIVRTGSGGLHYFYRHPGHFVVYNSTSWVSPGIDIRGNAGQVVAPPSVSGRGPYEVIADHPIAEAPQWLLDQLREHSENVEHGRSSETKSAEPVDVAMMPEKVRVAASTLVDEDEGRYKQFHHIVASCLEAGYTQGQTVTIVAPWCIAVAKYVGRIEAEVARCWGKIQAKAQRENEWLDGIEPEPTAPNTPPTIIQPTDGTTALQPDPAPSDTTEDDTPELDPTWTPVDLTLILSGEYQPEVPNLFPRTDHHNLVYAGRVHSFHGESESGKSLVVQSEAARLIQNDQRVLFIDFESDAPAVVGRLLEMGCTPHQIQHNFDYLRPDNDPRNFAHERQALAQTLTHDYALTVVDGMTDALGIFGAGSTDNDEIAAFMRAFPRMIARKTRAAVILIDHVTKDADTRGRYALGGQAKMNALDGSAFVVEVIDPIGQGMRGTISLRVAKDRPGGVRPHSGPFRKGDRTQEAARVIVDSTGVGIQVTVEPPTGHVNDPTKPTPEFRPTIIMARISDFLTRAENGVSWNSIRDNGGNEKTLRKAIAILDSEGYISIKSGPNNSKLHTLTMPYNPDQDPLSDTYTGWVDDPSGAGGDMVATSGDTKDHRSGGDAVPPPLGDGATYEPEKSPGGDTSGDTGSNLSYLACKRCGEEYLAAALDRGICDDCGPGR